METTDTINLDVDHIVETVISDAQERYEEGEIAYGAAVEAAEDHLDEHTYSMTEQMFIVETLLATLGLDKETYLYHTLEDAGYTSDSTAIIQQLCVNALTAIALQEGFDETVDRADSREESPPQELAVDAEEVVEELEGEAKDRYSNDTDAFDAHLW